MAGVSQAVTPGFEKVHPPLDVYCRESRMLPGLLNFYRIHRVFSRYTNGFKTDSEQCQYD